MNATRACGNVPPATYSPFPDCVRTQSHSQTEYTLCTCTQTLCTHTHAHTYKQPCNDTDSSPAGRCQTPGRSKPRTSPSRCFYFILFIFSWADGMSEASSGSGSPQSITSLVNRRSWERHLVTSVCASWWKIASEGTHMSDFCGLTNLILPKKREHK